MKFSVITSVYKNDKPEFVEIALDSIINQTVVPSEIILVVDGPISNELESLINTYEDNDIFKIVRLKDNHGLGKVLEIGVNAAKNELIARMDSDDIALPDRFSKQIRCFEEDETLSICGGAIAEFIDNPDNVVGYRICPTDDRAIKEFMKHRCGFNHMTVMFRKSAVLKAGNYQHWFWNEDYYLWLRMMLKGAKFKNLPDVLVNVRVGKDMYARRGGLKYFKSELALQNFMLSQHIIGLGTYSMNVIKRLIVQVLLPNSLRGWVFRTFARK